MTPIPTTQKRPFIPAAGIVQLEALYTYLGQKCENVFHFRLGTGGGAPTLAQMTTIAATYAAWESATGKQTRSNQASLTSLIARDLTTQESPALEYATGLPIVGAGGNQPLPGNVSVAVKWSTALRGRSFRGRTFHIGLTADHIVGDQLAGTFHDPLQAAYNNLLQVMLESAGATMVVLSYASHKFWRDAGLATPVTQATINLDLDSQRRRLAGRGQ